MLSGQSVTGLPALDSHDGVDATLRKAKGGGFQTMGLNREELKSVLGMGFSVPTPIQRKAIPILMQGSDVVAMARTGSGKTAAYAIPIIHKLKEHTTVVGIRGLVLAPTRELSLQIMREMQKLGRHSNLRYCALVGGGSLEDQFARLAENPDVVIATPGRLLHIMEEAKLGLTAVSMVVLDEADRLFEQGLQPQIVAILGKVNEDCQRALFSATMPSILAEFTEAKLHNPVVVRLDSEAKLSDTLKQAAFFVRTSEKPAALVHMLRAVLGVDARTAQALIFVESKHHVEFFVALLNEISISTVGVHGGMDQEARKEAVDQFSRRKVSAMVVTDVAARGIDLPLLDNVINYSFPAIPKIFIHRVGRVARAGRSGKAYSLLTYDDMPYYIDLMDFLGRPLQTTPSEDAPRDLLFTPDDGCYGRMPENDIQRNVDYVKSLVEARPDLEATFNVMQRAHQKYTRTKKKASGASVRESRDDSDLRFENMPLHPIFAEQQTTAAKEQQKAVFDLRRFKTNQTYLDLVHGGRVFDVKPRETLQSLRRAAGDGDAEADARPLVSQSGVHVRNNPTGRRAARSEQEVLEADDSADDHPVGGASSGRPLSLAERLLAKARDTKTRDTTDVDGFARTATTRAARRGETNDDAERYQDRDFFMPTVRDDTVHDQHYSVKDVAVDFVADNAEDMQKQRSVFAWNKKKNRFIKTNVNEAKAMLVGIKNEAGKKIDFKTKLEAYSKWTKSSNLRIQDVGEQEDTGAMARARALKAEVAAGDDDEEVDISDPNQGKKLRMGRKLRKLPKEGRTRSFDELKQIKDQKHKEKAKLDARRKRKASRGIKPKRK